MQLHLECSTGISGDMFLAAMSDLGLDLSPFQALVRDLGLEVSIEARPTIRNGLSGTALDITPHAERYFRNLEDIQALITHSGLSAPVKEQCRSAFTRLAETEASVHGIEVAKVHFHEVGAVDTIIDVLGCFWALERLNVSAVSCSRLPWFQGFVETEHGRLPLPAPATARLLQGKPVYPTGFEQEIITPTGALILDQIVTTFDQGPLGRLETSGTGWGSMDLGPIPNGLRAFVLQPESPAAQEDVWVLESNLDHLSGEDLGSLFFALQTAGALDLIYLPGLMKKNRPGGLLQVLCRPDDLSRVQETFFEHSLTLGIRRRLSERVVLPREAATLQTPLGQLQAKTVHFRDRAFTKPEFAALQELAEKTGRSVAEVRYMLGISQEQHDKH